MSVSNDDAKRFLERHRQVEELLEYSVHLYTGAVANLNDACSAYGTGLNGEHDTAKQQDAVLRAMWLSEKLLESIGLYATYTHEFFCLLTKLESRYELKVLKMRYLDGKDVAEIAEAMGLSTKQVHRLKNQGISSVRLILEKCECLTMSHLDKL